MNGRRRVLTFEPGLACRIGVTEAVILQQIRYWLSRPKAGEHHDGRKWVFNSVAAWQEQFPFFGMATIGRALLRLERRGLLLVGRYNKRRYDKTKWYAVDEGAVSRLLEGDP